MNSAETDSNNGITILDIFNTFLANKVLIISLGIIGLIAAILISYIIKPIYTSEVLMVSQLENQTDQTSGLAGLAGLTGLSLASSAGSKEAVKAMAILKSRTFRLHVVNSEDLKPYLFPDLWDKEKSNWIDLEPSDLAAASELNELIEIKKSENGLIRFSISSPTAEFSSFLSNRIILLVNNYLRSQVIVEAEQSISLLKEELKTTKLAALEQTIYSQIEGHTKSKTLANVREEYAFKVIDAAIEPKSPSWPNKLQIQLMGLVVGILSGLMISLYIGFLRRKA